MKHLPLSRRVACLATAMILLPLGSASAQVPPPHSIQSADGSVTLQYRTGSAFGLRFTKIARGSASFTLLQTDVWTVRLREIADGDFVPPCTSCELDLGGIRPSQSTFTESHTKTASSFSYTWGSVTYPGVATFDVTVTGNAVDGSGGEPGHIELEIDIDYSGSLHSIYSVVFPRVAVREREFGDAKNQFLVVPLSSGQLLSDPVHTASLRTLIHPGHLSMQFFAYYNANEGSEAPLLFLGTRDVEGDLKQFDLDRQLGAGGQAVDYLYLQLKRYPPENLTATEFAPDYPFVLSVLSGDWYDAARYYRGWATGPGVPWTEQGPMHDDDAFPAAVKDARMVLFTSVGQCCAPAELDPTCAHPNLDYDAFAYWDEHVEDHQQFFGVQDLLTLVYHWDANSFPDGIWGEWLPAHEPFPDQAELVGDIPGHSFVAYFNPTEYTGCLDCEDPDPCDAPYFNLVQAKLSQDEDHEPRPAHAFTPGTRHFVSGACGTVGESNECLNWSLDQRSTFVFNYIKTHALALKEMGAKGLYLDAYTPFPAELSYNELVTGERDLPGGGGPGWTLGKLLTLEFLINDPDLVLDEVTGERMFFISEGAQEMYLRHVPVVFPAHKDEPGSRFAGSVADTLIAPVFQTVYHDYLVCGDTIQAVAPVEVLGEFTPEIFRRLRMEYAAKLFAGHGLWGGSVLSPDLIGDLRSANASYADYADMIQAFASVLRHDEARELTTFGERMRDPVLSDHETIQETGDVWVPYGAEQPYVYAAVFRRTDPGPRPSIGILLLNWSDADDDTPGTPGDQTLDLTIGSAEYGLSGDYALSEIRSQIDGSVEIVPMGSFDADSDHTLDDVEVPERSARFFRAIPE